MEETQKRASQAVNIEYLLNWTAHTAKRNDGDPTQVLALDANDLNIQSGRRAVLPKDFVTLDQAVHEEEKKLEWLELGVPTTKESPYIFEDDRIVMVSNPKAPF